LFVEEEEGLHLAGASSRPTTTRRAPAGYFYYDPEELWQTVAVVIREIVLPAGVSRIAAVGIASMAETGLFVDRWSGAPRSVLLPWFDTSATLYPQLSRRLADSRARTRRFSRTGIRPSFKNSLAKILWLRAQDESLAEGTVWLSAADYIAFRLSGQMSTDYSLAGRTFAFRIDQKTWDEDWLQEFGLGSELFPRLMQSGAPVGVCGRESASQTGLAEGTPVSIAGHDHVCAAFAAGAIKPGLVFDSIGTAETLVGALDVRALGETEYQSGLAYGCHVSQGRFYWMGGLSASGGSVEWVRSILGDPPLAYPELESLAASAPAGPTGILYFPYLSGSGSPHSDPEVRGAFVGLEASHGRAALLKAVLEGTAYEMEFIRRAAEEAIGLKIEAIIAAGGGTRNRHWMQIKADVSGCRLEVPPMPEATLLGAALLAGLGSGVFADEQSALAARPVSTSETILPDASRNQAYRTIFEQGYLPLQAPLRGSERKPL
jgi:xylulokinase